MKPTLVIAMLFTSIFALAGCAQEHRRAPAGPATSARAGTRAPDWAAPTLTGRELRFASLGGRPVYLNFFASWCHGCNEEADSIDATARRFAKRGLRVVGIDVGENVKMAAAFRDWHHLRYPIVVDSGRIREAYHVGALPVQVFIDRNGMVVNIVRGQLSADAMRANVQNVL